MRNQKTVDTIVEDPEPKEYMLLSPYNICNSELEDFDGILDLSEDVLYILDTIERVVKEKEEEIHLVKFDDFNRQEDSLIFSMRLPTQVTPYAKIHEKTLHDCDEKVQRIDYENYDQHGIYFPIYMEELV
jgi:hypothetical protein